MENEEFNEQTPDTPTEAYQERPRWQVWLARIGLVIFILFLIMYYSNLFRGGA